MVVSPEKSVISQRKFAVLPKRRSWVAFLLHQAQWVKSFPSSSYILQSPRGTNVTGIPLPGPSPLAQNETFAEDPAPDPRPESATALPLPTQLQVSDVSASLSIPSEPIPSPAEDVPMFEAVALSSSSSGDESEGDNAGKRKKIGRDSIKLGPVQESQDEIPDEVAAFLPMLEEYLKCKPQGSGTHWCGL
jgi:hypothetical protein